MKKLTKATGSVLAGVAVGVGVLAGCHTTTVKSVPGPTVTHTATTAPATTQPVIPGSPIATFNGSGNETTKSFQVPSSEDFVVTWTYSGNADDNFGTSEPDNFIVNLVNSDDSASDFSLPNDIAASGHGSTEVTGDDLTSDSFNVQAGADSTWTLTVTAAS
jgi:hypothetical protein